MTDSANDSALRAADALLKHYSFDRGEFTNDQLLDRWLRTYPPRWVRLALVEALYQGRYKAISVEQILILWVRRGHPIHRFGDDFESLVCNNLPKNLLVDPDPMELGERFIPLPSHLEAGSEGLRNSPATIAPHETTVFSFPPNPAAEAPIQEFQPEPSASDFYTKLTEIAHNWNSSNPSQITQSSRSR
jgi:hypothetical protein